MTMAAHLTCAEHEVIVIPDYAVGNYYAPLPSGSCYFPGTSGWLLLMQNSGPWDQWLPVVENSQLFAQPRTVHGVSLCLYPP